MQVLRIVHYFSFFSAVILIAAQITLLIISHKRDKSNESSSLIVFTVLMSLFCLYDFLVFSAALHYPDITRSLSFRLGIIITIAMLIIWFNAGRLIKGQGQIYTTYTTAITAVLFWNFIIFTAGEFSLYDLSVTPQFIVIAVTGLFWIAANIIAVLFIYHTQFARVYSEVKDEKARTSDTDHHYDLESRIAEITEEYGITDREADILRLISRGMSNNEIAKQLYISTSTVKSHIHSILQKTDLKSRAEIMCLLYKRDLSSGSEAQKR